MMPLAEGLKVVIAEAYQSFTMSNDKMSHLSKLNHLHETVKLFALIVEATADIRHPLIDLDRMLRTVDLERVDLVYQVGFLSHTRHSTIDDGQALFLRNQPTILQVLVMGIVAPIRGRALRSESALSVPLLQGVSC